MRSSLPAAKPCAASTRRDVGGVPRATVRACATLLLASTVTLPTACSSTVVSVEAAYMQTEVAGNVGLGGSSGGALATHDLRHDLNLTADAGSPYGRVELYGDRWRLSVSGFGHDQSAGSVLAQPFGDIPTGTPVNTDFTALNVKATLGFDLLDLPFGDWGYFRFAPALSGDYIKTETRVTAQTIAAFESVDTQVIVPMPTLIGSLGLGPVEGRVDAGGLRADLGDGDGEYFDVEAFVFVRPTDALEIVAGYRWIKANVNGTADSRDFVSNVQLRGWFLGGGFRF